MKNKIRYRKCKICQAKYEVNPLRPLFPCCSIEHAFEYQKILKANKEKKDWKDKKAVMKIDTHSKEHKKALQDNINKLARMIDAYFDYTNCIDCGKFMSKQIDACHLISRKKNSSLRFNLHNLHSGCNACNVYNENHESAYKLGITLRYGGDYLSMIEGLPLQCKEIHLNNAEINNKLILTRKLIRDFSTFNLDSSMMARYLFNKIIGIYK